MNQPKDTPQCPPIPADLVTYMERRFYHNTTRIAPGDSARQVGIYIGQSQVINWMRRMLDKQNQNILD